MPISSETRAALELLKDVQQKVRQTDNLRSNQQVNADLTTLISVLESPVFQSILNIQDSLRELKRQVQLHPSILPSDFDITPSGELVLNLPPTANQQRGNEQHPTPLSQNGMSHPNTTSESFHRETQNGYADEGNQDVNQTPQSIGMQPLQQAHPEMEENNINLSNMPEQMEFDDEQKNGASHFMDEAFRQKVEAAGQGRQLKYIRLHKPEGTSLGFSVVGLKSENKGELGIYVQEIQPHGIAAKDGQLREADQILAIDGQALDSNISHQQAINILQRARGNVDLAVARNPETESDPINESEKAKSNAADSNIGSDWCQVEVIELVNNGSGLGFGIIGGQQAGVIVKTILRDGVADKDGRLKPNDFILQINEHWLQGVGSEQVAVVLRGTGSHVRLVVARPVDPSDPSVQRPNVPILPSAILTDRKALEMHLATGVIAEQTPAPPPPMDYDKFGPPPFDSFGPTTSLANDMVLPTQSEQVSIQHNASKSIDQTTSPMRSEDMGSLTAATRFGGSSNEESMQPEMITLDVELVKDAQGLGVTIAGYTCEREELSGIFVKSVTEGSAAYRSGKVAVNDQIIEVDGRSIQGYTNQQAVEMLRSTGQVVRLKLIRYVHGFKFEQLQQAIANSQQPQQQKQDNQAGMIRTDSVISEEASVDISNSAKSNEKEANSGKDILMEVEETFEGELDPVIEKGLITHWSKIMGPQYEIAVAQMAKFKPNGGLGISLEGTVEKVDGEEQNPHHYIRSVLPNGPVGQNGTLKSGDELLEVNGKKLLGLYHTDVVSILKDLPMHVRIVCARSNQTETQTDFANPMMARSTDYSLQGSVSSNLVSSNMDKQDRLFKAKSDGSIASSSGTTTEASQKESKLKSRSLEPLTSLAMWSDEIIAIELVKAEKGLGFSILDYQDPMNKDETVVVIR
jgi:C-terminal processing protease CtpA/Prc